jgi:lysophospholipase L1-like esterase
MALQNYPFKKDSARSLFCYNTHMRVLVFGDSITQGFWDTEGGWVERIRNHYDSLQVTDLSGRDEPVIFNLGISADNSAGVLKRIKSEVIARTRLNDLPVVIIQIGVNDSSADSLPADESVSVPIDNYEQNLKAIIAKVQPLSSKVIFVGLSPCDEPHTTPVAWGDYHYTNNAIKNYESTMGNVAAELGVAFIPVFDAFKEEMDSGKDLLPDGLHPNNKGHQLVSEIVMKQLGPLLKQQLR